MKIQSHQTTRCHYDALHWALTTEGNVCSLHLPPHGSFAGGKIEMNRQRLDELNVFLMQVIPLVQAQEEGIPRV